MEKHGCNAASGEANPYASCEQNIAAIRRWIKGNRKYYARQDDSFIWRFLRVCQFDEETTKKLICAYYDLRQSHKHWFQWPMESGVLHDFFVKQHGMYVMLPEKPNAPTIGVMKPGAFDLSKLSLDGYNNFMTLMIETHLEKPKMNSQDIHVILDVKNIGLGFMAQLNPPYLWGCSKLQTNTPIGYKHLHIVNGSIYLNMLLRLLKVFLNKDFYKQIINHGSDEKSLHKVIPPEFLPFEYGGTAGPEQQYTDATYKVVKKGKQFYLQNQKFGKDKFPKS